MAFDKIIDSAKLDGALSATADAIRSKTGATDSIPWDETAGFKAAVDSMEIGGSSEWETVMPATDVAFTDGGEYISFETVYPLTTGKRYKVKWGDTEYESTAVDTVFDGMPCVAIGNVGALAGNPSTEPFVIGYIPAANGFGIFRLDGSDEAVNVTIYVSTIPVPVILPLEITENGTFSAPEGVDGYSPITVNVASSGGGSIEGAHTITFMSEDGSAVYGTKLVVHGDTSGDPIALSLFETPTKESTAQYDYSFYGWATAPNGAADSNALKNITGDKTLYANFASAVRYYTVNYYDGDTLLKTEQLAYGTTPNYTPKKEGYEFIGWTSTPVPVVTDTDYHAQFVEKIGGNLTDTVTWKIENGVLTLTGTGDTGDLKNGSAGNIFYKYRDLVTSVVVEEGITRIGSYCCLFLNSITSMSLPSSLIEIGDQAFANCPIPNIVLPENIETIGGYAFNNNTAITTNIVIPMSVTEIGYGAFVGCTNASGVVIENNTVAWNGWYYGTKKITLSTAQVGNPSTMKQYLITDTTKNYYKYRPSGYTG